MKILIIHQYYKTPQEGGAIRSYYIARHLADLGHEVEVITAFNEKKYRSKRIGKVTVHYLPVYYTNHLSFISRIHAFYRFVRKTIDLIKRLQPVDLNYVITTPLTTGLIALYAKKRFGTPYIFEVGDLWPDAPVSLGVLKNKFLMRAAYRLEALSYKHAYHLIALSSDIKKAIQLKIQHREVEVLTNMADVAFFDFTRKKEALVAKFDVEHKFVIAYTGTVGMANQLEYLLDVAALANQYNKPLQFLVAGSGARWEAIKEEAGHRALNNITFIDFVDKNGVKEILNVADAVFISFKNVPVLSTGSPNKLFDGLAAGKLIITNFKGWIGELIIKHQCGFSYSPESPQHFFDKLEPYLHDQHLLTKAQANAYQLAGQFTPEIQLSKLTRIVKQFEDYHRP